MFLVKREESRDFDVFFGVFLGIFLVFGREKKCREELDREKISEKMCVPWSVGCLGLFIASGTKIEAKAIVGTLAAIQGPPASNGF